MSQVRAFGVRRSVANFLLDAFDGVLGSEANSDRERRQSFISANMLAGVVGVVLWLMHWVVLGPVDFVTGVFLFFLWVPLFLGVWVQNGGALETGEAGSALCLGAFIVFTAAFTGGVSSPALPWLLIVPLEAAISGRRFPVAAAVGISGFGFFLCAVLELMGWMPISRVEPGIASFVYGASLFAAMIVGTLTLRSIQRRHELQLESAHGMALLHRSLTNNSADLISRHLASGTVIYASPAVEELLGVQSHEFEGLSPAMFVHIQDLKKVESAFARTLIASPHIVEFRLRRRDGSYVPVEMKTQSIDGEIVAVTREVAMRNARVAELTVARDQAEETSQARLRFLASVTHELRTPLNAIIGFADMMRNEVFGPVGHSKYSEYADHIRDSGLHLVDLVSDLLDMSKIEAGKFTIERRRVELAPLFDECVAMVSGSAETAGVIIECDVSAKLFLFADRRALKQSLVNLLSNSIKFTLSEGRVKLSAMEADGDVVIKIADTGVGIPAADIHRIGKPFEQVEGGMTALHKGTGLGLSLVKALTELHGGDMEIESALGDGTTVQLRLPQLAHDDVPKRDETLVFPEKFRSRG